LPFYKIKSRAKIHDSPGSNVWVSLGF